MIRFSLFRVTNKLLLLSNTVTRSILIKKNLFIFFKTLHACHSILFDFYLCRTAVGHIILLFNFNWLCSLCKQFLYVSPIIPNITEIQIAEKKYFWKFRTINSSGIVALRDHLKVFTKTVEGCWAISNYRCWKRCINNIINKCFKVLQYRTVKW